MPIWQLFFTLFGHKIRFIFIIDVIYQDAKLKKKCEYDSVATKIVYQKKKKKMMEALTVDTATCQQNSISEGEKNIKTNYF